MAQERAQQQSDEKLEYYDAAGFVDYYKEPGSLMTFNIWHGYLEALLRGFRSGFLTEAEYRTLAQSETLEDFKICFQETDFVDILQSVDISAKLTSQVVVDRVWGKFVEEFEHLRNQAVGELATFMHYIQYEYQIKNVTYLISGLINQNDPLELIAECDEMGRFPRMRTVLTFENVDDGIKDLYRSVLVDTPIGKYFEKFLETFSNERDNLQSFPTIFNEQDIDLIKETVMRYWYEDFYTFCKKLGGQTAEIMCDLLEFEADQRAIQIMVNSFNTPLNDISKQRERQQLFCSFGALYPEGIEKFANVSDQTQLGDVLQGYQRYNKMWQDAMHSTSDEDIASDLQMELLREQVRMNVLAFEQASHFACFYAYTKLKATEKNNIYWIAECIIQKKKDQVDSKIIPLFSKSM